MDKSWYPEIINNFHMYKGTSSSAEQLIGMTGEVELPQLQAMKETISGSGILGEIDVPNPGHFSAFDIEIPFCALCEDMFGLGDQTKRQMLTMRACEQSTVKSTGEAKFSGMRVVLGGKTMDYKLGKAKLGGQMDSSVTLACSYIKIEVDGKTKLELDKYNEVYIVDGKDVLATIKSKC